MIDQHWREHLYEMDYLREGINLRAMGQKDPLAEWQREGFDMFEAMMGQIQDQFVAYVSHLQVAAVEEAPRAPATEKMRYSAAEDPVQGSGAMRATAASMPAEELMGADPFAGGGAPEAIAPEPENMMPVRVDKTPGRNEPCFCGSGKKYKLCHGR
jgi:preprotein translocase subunit SecA